MPTEKAIPTRPAPTLHQHVPITGASRFIGRPMAEHWRAVNRQKRAAALSADLDLS